jgi:hypothetical protein
MDRARDFASNFVLKIEEILDVFQDFYKQKNRPRHKKEFLELPKCLQILHILLYRTRGGCQIISLHIFVQKTPMEKSPWVKIE